MYCHPQKASCVSDFPLSCCCSDQMNADEQTKAEAEEAAATAPSRKLKRTETLTTFKLKSRFNDKKVRFPNGLRFFIPLPRVNHPTPSVLWPHDISSRCLPPPPQIFLPPPPPLLSHFSPTSVPIPSGYDSPLAHRRGHRPVRSAARAHCRTRHVGQQ